MDIKLWKACRSGCPHSQLTEAQQLRRPMRLSVEQGKGSQKMARYDAEATLSRLRRQAKSDGDNASSSLRILSELLAVTGPLPKEMQARAVLSRECLAGVVREVALVRFGGCLLHWRQES
ncbi:hypothetical protein [Aeromonas veronii]|uniref:hypothetical protein n=1 Tax=Aeromonas veronii TaxID=654 RepID=UPI001F1E7226|nr:hypothetical protein [Aeromonas veronii]